MSRLVFRSPERICISFDWDHDRDYRHMLSAWNAKSDNPVNFEDLTPTDNVDRIKVVLTTKIRAATHTLVLIGEYANRAHKDRAKIGTLNWIWWEIERSKEEGKRLIAVNLRSTNETPAPLLNSGAKWAMSFTLEAILKAIDEA